MDIGTQGLASLVIARAFVPRAGWRAWAVIVVAGTIANVDFFSSMMSPRAYLTWHRTYAHSVVVALIAGAGLSAAYLFAASKPSGAARMENSRPKFSRMAFLAGTILAALLHLALDAAQSAGTMIFWPLSRQRVALDWLPRVDPWIIAILLGALLLPELTRLVSDEIGAKSTAPTGRIGAILGLVILALYVGLRADMHSNALATLQNRNYDTGSPRRIAAYPDSASPFEWHGIVETVRALHQPIVNLSAGLGFDPDEGETQFKPESSPILDRAQQSDSAKHLLAVAAFPKADVENTPDGYEIKIRDLRYAATGDAKNEVEARIQMDQNGKLLNDDLVWARDAKLP